jgi:hypothetical protein
MRFGLLFSILLHACIIAAAFVSLPDSWRTKVIADPVVPIELIADAELAERTSVPAAAPKPKPEVKPAPDLPAPEKIETPKPEPKAEPEPKPEPPPVKVEPEPAPVKPEVKPEPEPQAPKPKPKPKPAPKNNDLDLDALSALVDKAKQNEPSSSGTPSDPLLESETPRAAVGAGDRLTASEVDKMRAAVARCWNASAIIGAPEPEKLVVVLDIDLNRDGSLKGAPRVLNSMQINMSGNRFWKVAEQNAVRAVSACAPYDFFDQSRYQEWNEFTLNFDPSLMAGF